MGNSILSAMEVLYGVEDGVAHGRYALDLYWQLSNETIA